MDKPAGIVLKCPFCGREGIIITNCFKEEIGGCKRCGAWVPLEIWNTRPKPQRKGKSK